MIAQAVFAHYRWLGWLDRTEPLPKQLQQATELARQFAAAPASIPDAELLAKAIPAWTSTLMETPVEWLRTLQAEPTLWLRTRPDRTEELAAKLHDCQRAEGTSLATALSYLGIMDLFRTPEFQAGEFEVQDIASQAVGWLCSPNPGETWWDACAGEGGKTLHLADLMENKGLIWATDRVTWRLLRLKRRAARARVFNYRTALWDGSAKLPTRTRFDGVLVDAPCSGVGTWQRNPQAKWTLSVKDVAELAEVQLKLLEHVSASVKPGGKLIYSVCTLTRPETMELARNFEKRVPEFTTMSVVNPFEIEAKPRPDQAWWPQQTRGNGMFVSVWKRSGSET
jgi:16S rRNA (cytosine967-C5)-methyltransferase